MLSKIEARVMNILFRIIINACSSTNVLSWLHACPKDHQIRYIKHVLK